MFRLMDLVNDALIVISIEVLLGIVGIAVVMAAYSLVFGKKKGKFNKGDRVVVIEECIYKGMNGKVVEVCVENKKINYLVDMANGTKDRYREEDLKSRK